MSHFMLKIIAMVTMFCDHLGYAIYGKLSYLNYIGRLSFPIFAFGIGEGYLHTKSKKNYLMRLFIFALVSQAPFMFFNSMFRTGFSLNIFFTLFLGLVAIIGYEKCENKYVGLLLVACLGLTADAFHMDYGYFGIFTIFIFHVLKEKKLWMNFAFVGLCLAKYVPLYLRSNFHYAYIFLFLSTVLSLVFINLYNGKKGKDIRYLLYAFYPAHLILLYVFHILCIA